MAKQYRVAGYSFYNRKVPYLAVNTDHREEAASSYNAAGNYTTVWFDTHKREVIEKYQPKLVGDKIDLVMAIALARSGKSKMKDIKEVQVMLSKSAEQPVSVLVGDPTAGDGALTGANPYNDAGIKTGRYFGAWLGGYAFYPALKATDGIIQHVLQCKECDGDGLIRDFVCGHCGGYGFIKE